ncbi:putative Polypyrimidine tract-binding protein [Blattamonas nauphoetae]|uniref:Polypyrimidine tract-binding protein n=1 Tax=Blattamonas nauphoetae TaxID=2049346 RepID=A0ABQ9YJ51_9EUKA|nr:putative Polypyrimidine tract-binding protein [Blattamonas nauphoetae]
MYSNRSVAFPPFPSVNPSSAPVFRPRPRSETTPSRVVHIRNVPPSVLQSEILKTGQQFGVVNACIPLKQTSQYLMEFQDLDGAKKYIEAYGTTGLQLGSTVAFVQYSIRQELNVQEDKNAIPADPSRILHIVITNVLYEINVSVLSMIFNQYDTSPRQTVEKMIIFQKMEDVQALIQFSSVEGAQKAKKMLNGKNIYSSCCTLHIEDSKLNELTIRENSFKSYDFTNPHLPQNYSYPYYQQQYYQGYGQQNYPMMQSQTSPVLLVNNFAADKVGCDQLFNLFSNYGMISCVKLMHNKTNSALVQYGDPADANRAMAALRGVTFYGSALEVTSSKHMTIKRSQNFPEEDSNTQVYDHAKNRSINISPTGHRNTAAPGDTLHISNIAETTTEEALRNHLQQHGNVVNLKIYDHNDKKMALAKFERVYANYAYIIWACAFIGLLNIITSIFSIGTVIMKRGSKPGQRCNRTFNIFLYLTTFLSVVFVILTFNPTFPLLAAAGTKEGLATLLKAEHKTCDSTEFPCILEAVSDAGSTLHVLGIICIVNSGYLLLVLIVSAMYEHKYIKKVFTLLLPSIGIGLVGVILVVFGVLSMHLFKYKVILWPMILSAALGLCLLVCALICYLVTKCTKWKRCGYYMFLALITTLSLGLMAVSLVGFGLAQTTSITLADDVTISKIMTETFSTLTTLSLTGVHDFTSLFFSSCLSLIGLVGLACSIYCMVSIILTFCILRTKRPPIRDNKNLIYISEETISLL